MWNPMIDSLDCFVSTMEQEADFLLDINSLNLNPKPPSRNGPHKDPD